MSFWQRIKKDLEKGVKSGVSIIKEGAQGAKEKVEELSEEAKIQYEISVLESKVHTWMTELGGRVYEVSHSLKNPMLDTKVKMMVTRISKLQARIEKLENAKGNGVRKKGLIGNVSTEQMKPSKVFRTKASD
jgi:hypothetical protein